MGQILIGQERLINKEIPNLYNRIETTERNLNYYNMIHSIMTENRYVNLELLENPLRKGRNILVVGFYGAYNLGDELMFQIVVNVLKENECGNITVMLCDNEQYDICDFPDIQFVHYPKSRFDFNILAQRYDVIIWGGGALLDDAYYADKTKVDYLGNMFIDLNKRFIAFEKKILVLGLSTNKEFTNKKYVENINDIIEGSTFFSVRDIYSQSLLIKDGANRKKINILNDLVFAEEKWETIRKENREHTGIIIGIDMICITETKTLLEEIVRIIMRIFDEKLPIKVMFIPFYDYNQNDTSFYRAFMDELDVRGIEVEVCDYVNTFSEIMDRFKGIDFFINMRYHAMLLSMVLGIPSTNIVLDSNPHYFNKMSYLAELGKYSDSLIAFSEGIVQIEKKICEMVKKKERPVIEDSVFEQTRAQIRNIVIENITEAE